MRDDFSAPIKNALAKRVAFKCSNPNCSIPTISPKSDKLGSVNTGVAAHITAASSGSGAKRYDDSLTPQQRADIENGIWLCQNCAKLIDSDENVYTVEVLKLWKFNAEQKAIKAVNGASSIVDTIKRPYAEPVLIWITRMRSQIGISPKTLDLSQQRNSEPIHPFEVIRIASIVWRYKLKIFNNSSENLYNLRLLFKNGAKNFTALDVIPKRSSIAALEDFSLNAESEIHFEGTGEESLEKMQSSFYPAEVQGIEFLLEYQSENRDTYFTECIFQGEDFSFNHITCRPSDY